MVPVAGRSVRALPDHGFGRVGRSRHRGAVRSDHGARALRGCARRPRRPAVARVVDAADAFPGGPGHLRVLARRMALAVAAAHPRRAHRHRAGRVDAELAGTDQRLRAARFARLRRVTEHDPVQPRAIVRTRSGRCRPVLVGTGGRIRGHLRHGALRRRGADRRETRQRPRPRRSGQQEERALRRRTALHPIHPGGAHRGDRRPRNRHSGDADLPARDHVLRGCLRQR
ncbi:hypothetical protein L612_000600002450 [Rhodococcus rhodochrous J38]|nr:hypothetical protein L612_000600002450 [Rhodococcus rhodochrous J38]